MVALTMALTKGPYTLERGLWGGGHKTMRAAEHEGWRLARLAASAPRGVQQRVGSGAVAVMLSTTLTCWGAAQASGGR